MSKKVVVGMSGGVDSTMAAVLLKQAGFEVEGVTLKYWYWDCPQNERLDNVCCSDESLERTKYICDKMDIKHRFIDFEDKFKKYVIDNILAGYKKGEIPNPCIACNQYLKFGFLLDMLSDLEADYLATGHYAKIVKKADKYIFMQPKDLDKDQTYFLYRQTQNSLSRLIFPLGDLLKEDVKEQAQNLGFNFYSKIKESQDLCFVSGGGLNSFLESELGKVKGDILLEDGTKVGEHNGYYHYTLGQRRGLGDLKVPTNSGPYFVMGVQADKNIVIVSNKISNDTLFKDEIKVPDFHLIDSDIVLDGNKAFMAKYRSTGKLSPLIIKKEKDYFILKWKEPQRALTPGQHVVVYDEGMVVGGCKII